MTAYDAIVIGAGPNGLVAANHLVDAGWSVLVLEEQPDPGGAVRSSRDVHPDFMHDTFSAFHPLAVVSPAIGSLRLAEYGLRWSHAPAVLGHPLPDGGWALLHRDRELTAAGFEAAHPGDGAAWLELCERWDRIGEQLMGALLTPFPPVRHGLGLLARLTSPSQLDLVRSLMAPVRSLGDELFGGAAPKLLLAGSAGHTDIPLTASGSGLLGIVLTMLGQTVGFPTPVGGAGALSQALVRRLISKGGQVQCESPVARVEVTSGRARGVVLSGGERFIARQAVIATVLAPRLYRGLLDPAVVPQRTMAALRRFELDHGTLKVDWALDGPVPWASPPASSPGTLHIADSVHQIDQSLSQVAAGVVPAAPFLLAGQMTTADPSRSPAGTEALWAYTHIPQQVVQDAGHAGITGDWGNDDCERLADRMQERIEALAPGFGSRVLARRILGPAQLQSRDANLVGGAVNGGTAQLHQQLFMRPILGFGRAETPVKGLFLGSASAHPGGGVHGAAGANAARAALARARLRRRR